MVKDGSRAEGHRQAGRQAGRRRWTRVARTPTAPAAPALCRPPKWACTRARGFGAELGLTCLGCPPLPAPQVGLYEDAVALALTFDGDLAASIARRPQARTAASELLWRVAPWAVVEVK